MPTIRRTFAAGYMDKDTDERLLPDGVYRHAENLNVLTSEDSDEGSAENSLSNKQLTYIDFGANAETIGGYTDVSRNLIYWFVVSDIGSFLMEYDIENKITTRVLQENTISPNDPVFVLKKNKRITGIAKIIGKEKKDDLFLWTDDNMEVCCINIERAKTYAVNGFNKEDIYLIKKPPTNPPSTRPLNLAIKSNDLKEDFFSFMYRYQYLDGEYSALSPYSKYVFSPKKYEIDYFELQNNGMINQFNAIKLEFDTGDKQVKKIQVCFKKSNSNNIYLIETFDKEKESWGDFETHSTTFTNNKIYKLLPEKELYRMYDNVPRKAKALTLAGNRVILGAYTEGYNMTKRNGEETKIDFSLTSKNYDVNDLEYLDYGYIAFYSGFTFDTPFGVEYKKGGVLSITINIRFNSVIVYNNTFELILSQDYNDILELTSSAEFLSFVDYINLDFKTHYNEDNEWTVPNDYALLTEPEITFSIISGEPTFIVTDIVFADNGNGGAAVMIPTRFALIMDGSESVSPIAYSNIENTESCKSDTSYSVALIYKDEFGRASTPQTSDKNTILIPHEDCDKKNRIELTINHEAPTWAKYFKVAVKSDPLKYQIVYVNEFYNDGAYVWAKLESANKDKVKPGDYLKVKIANGSITPSPILVKVLDVMYKEKAFIEGNETDGGLTPIEIIESEGTYMKIKPEGFSMDMTDYEILQDEHNDEVRENNRKPDIYLDMFTEGDYGSYVDKEIGEGASLQIWIESKRKYKRGWYFTTFSKTIYATNNYTSIEDWLSTDLFNGSSIFADELPGELKIDIKNDFSFIRGYRTLVGFVQSGSGRLYLKVTGHYQASASHGSWLSGKVSLRVSSGLYVFETTQKKIENEVYYELPETYEVNVGNHLGGYQNQFFNLNIPARIELSFFNCYAQGNGIESYKVKDDFNSNSLNIDSRPSLTSIEPYKEVYRYADITYSEPFVESSNINGLNEFNASTANWKELNKQDGPILILYSRESNILTIQKNKWGQVLYGKDLLFNSDGTTNLTSVPEVLGSFIPYAGDYGFTDPESFCVSGNRCYGVDKDRGLVLRLSQNGLSPIIRGMKDWFRDIFRAYKNAKVIGGVDSYSKNTYQISIGDKPLSETEVSCGNTIIKNKQGDPFSYILNLNDNLGEIQVEYSINGSATMIAEIGGQIVATIQVSTGDGDFMIPRNSIEYTQALITIIPYTELIDIELTNICPRGIPTKLKTIILCDDNNKGKTATLRMRVNDSNTYTDNIIFDSPANLIEYSGIEGKGRFPKNGDKIFLQVYDDPTDSVDKSTLALSYLISNIDYNEKDFPFGSDTAISMKGASGAFNYNNRNGDELTLYIIYDFRI